tara:strand:- start:1284 stop:2417 length:1134 start_codon:yes stop_codon:yes gene_type:complete
MDHPLPLKYRPKNLKQVIGQDVVTTCFTNAFKNERLHHAYILAGIKGSGKTSTARIVAAMENCSKGPTQDPCGECDNCKAIFIGKSNDVREMNAASNRGIDDIRALTKEIQFAGIECRTKYVIIDEAHSLTGHAAEAALKPIEEPPKNVRFILCTTALDSLIDTIRSRCIIHRFNKVHWQPMVENLKKIAKSEGVEYDEAALQIAARAAQGSVRNSLRNLQMLIEAGGGGTITKELASQSLGTIDSNLAFHFIDALIQPDTTKGLKVINRLFRDGKEVGQISESILDHLRRLMLSVYCKHEDMTNLGFTDQDVKKYVHQAGMCGKNDEARTILITRLVGMMIDFQRGVSLNLDPQIMLEKYFLEAVIVKKQVDASDV